MSGITQEFIAANHPEIAEAFRAEGRVQGAESERARIQAVEAQALPGHGDLINRLKFDGKTTGPEAAVQVLAAERAMSEARARQMQADAPQPAASAPAPTSSSSSQADADAALPLEDRAKKRWDVDASLRQEFGSFDAFLGYERAMAAGKVKVLGHKR